MGLFFKGYYVERRPLYTGGNFARLNHFPILDTFYTDRSVHGGDYEYRVIAVNDGGEGQPSLPLGPVSAKDQYG